MHLRNLLTTELALDTCDGASLCGTTAGGFLLVLAIVLPVAGVLLSLVLGGRHAERIALGLMPAGFGVAIAIAVLLWRSGKSTEAD
jgi:hypothetical protein